MNADKAVELLERLGCRKVRIFGNQVRSSCPHAELHRRGDRRPSFGAAISDDDRSPYLCFGCGSKGTLESLAYSTGNKDLVPFRKSFTFKSKTWRASDNRFFKRKADPVFFSDEYIKPFVGRVAQKILDRGIELSTARAWELGVDKENRRAIFVLRDVSGRVAVVIGRDLTGKSKVKYSNYVLDTINGKLCPFIDHTREEDFRSPTKSYFLYGEHKAQEVAAGRVSVRYPDLVIVEGAMDVLKLWQRGYNAVGVLGSIPSMEQADKIVSLWTKGQRVVVMGDGDKAGFELGNRVNDLIGRRVPLFRAQLPEEIDPGNATEEQTKTAFESAQMFDLTST